MIDGLEGESWGGTGCLRGLVLRETGSTTPGYQQHTTIVRDASKQANHCRIFDRDLDVSRETSASRLWLSRPNHRRHWMIDSLLASRGPDANRCSQFMCVSTSRAHRKHRRPLLGIASMATPDKTENGRGQSSHFGPIDSRSQCQETPRHPSGGGGLVCRSKISGATVPGGAP